MWGMVVGLLMTATGVMLVAIGSRSLDAASMRRVALLRASFVTSSSSEQYETFANTGAFGYAMDEPVYTSFYLWNLTNAADVLGGTVPPRVSQIGPYVYEKKTRKINVTFHASLPASVQGEDTGTTSSSSYGYVRYGVESTYAFVPQRSNGSETDVVVTLNATYARMLTKYARLGYSERLVVADYAQRHMESYHRHLRREFIADTKQRGLQFFLPETIETLTRESIAPAIKRQRERVDSASIPRNLVKMYAVARTEAIPQVLGDVRKDILDRFLPGILQNQLDAAIDHALPRVLTNLMTRLKVEAVPVLLEKQIETQYMRQVPFTLNSLAAKLPQLAFPYVLQETYERACLEAVPFLLRTIKLEVVERDTATNQVQVDVAQNNVIETWRKRSSSARVDFDSWIDDNPTGSPRTGFELRPTAANLEVSKEVATLLLGSKSSNKRFSIVDHDIQTTASYPLDVPLDTPVGFAIWKQVIALNETSISYLISGVNNDVALVSDYITRAQVLFIRNYLLEWARKDVTQRDRERFWRQNYAKRTSHSGFNEPAVDLDIEKSGIQAGFNVQASRASTSGITPGAARQLWNSIDPFSFVNAQGFSLWYEASVLNKASSIQALITGVPGLTNTHVTEISTWVSGLLGDGFITRRALRHWADGTCLDVFKLPRSSCLVYDLEPHVTGTQSGFEMNPTADQSIVISQALRDDLWDKSKPISFLSAVQVANWTKGYSRWMKAIRVNDPTDITTVISSSYASFTNTSASVITRWLGQWTKNDLHRLNVRNWWRTATCWTREELSNSSVTSTVTAGVASCTPSTHETEQQSPPATVSTATQSPFATTKRILSVGKVECVLDASSSTYTRTASSYQVSVREYSCDAFSTELSDDHADSDFKTGFELAPLLTTAHANLRPSLAVVSLLWDPTNAFSILHKEGYKMWIIDYPIVSSTARSSLVTAINSQVSAACTKLAAAGSHSSVFNVTLVGTDASCGLVTNDQADTIQKWISAVSKSTWVESGLLDVWRRGHDRSSIDIEPYRANLQSGWELTAGCQCSLAAANGTVYTVPRSALSLWDSQAHNASFLSSQGYSLWKSLSDATAAVDAIDIAKWRLEIATACGLTKWEPWLDHVMSWLEAWKTNEHLHRDVLGHWLHGTCPTPSTLPVIRVVSDGAPVSTTVTNCPPAKERYQISLNDTLDDILLAASRPTLHAFFDSEIVENTAMIQPIKVVEESETVVTCDFMAANQYEQTTQTRVTIKEYRACNFLEVLSAGTSASLPIVEQEAHFELNRSTDASYVSMDVALDAWMNSTGVWAFTNIDVFLDKWQPAIHRSEARATLESDINAAIASNKPSKLVDLTNYMQMWQTSSDSLRQLGQVWLRSTAPFYDLDAHTTGIQGGFELFSSAEWRKDFGAAAAASLPSLEQAQYLWDETNEYSFLNSHSQLSSRLPIGFSAWRAVYDGVDYSSERLVSKYPQVATVERDDTMTHSLSATERATLVTLMSTAAKLTKEQISGIASWVMIWAENVVLRDYILETWATGRTPRSAQDATIDFRPTLVTRFVLDSTPSSALPLDLFTTDARAVLGALPKVTRRSLWNSATVGSLLNPTSQDLWCVIDLPTLRTCAHGLNDLGRLNESNFDAFVRIAQPVVQDLEQITQSSNLTALAFKFFTREFGLTDDQTLAIASWWRSLPTKSAYFQALQVHRWQSTTNTLAAVDPHWVGFGLASIFPIDDHLISRRVSPSSLVANPTTVLSPSSCVVSLDLVFALWKQSSPSSFLHSDGQKKWIEYAQSQPRDSAAFVTLLSDSDATVKQIITTLSPTAASCNVDATANWVHSWGRHPQTRQLVESLWFQPSTASTSPLKFFSAPSALVLAFPVDIGVSMPPQTERTLRLHAKLVEIVFDINESMAFNNLTTGFPIWRALLSDCTSTSQSSFTCVPVDEANLNKAVANVALKELSSQLADRLQALDLSLDEDEDSVAQVIKAVFMPWLLYWLDHKLLLDWILEHAANAGDAFQGMTSTLTFGDFPAIQFASAALTKMSFRLPHFGPDPADYTEHSSLASERLTKPQLTFSEKTRIVESKAVEGMTGLAEFAAFCSWNSFDRVYAYDAGTTCALGSAYHVSLAQSRAILSTFGDTEDWTLPRSTLHVKRAALLIEALLALPFATVDDCSSTVQMLGSAYSLGLATLTNACQSTAHGFLLDLPLLSAMGFDPASLPRIKDFQAYFKHVATKFVYEPTVLGFSPRALNASDLVQAAPTPASWSVFPVGGYITAQPVSKPLTASDLRASLWQTDDPNSSRLARDTYLVPKRQDEQLLFSHRDRVLGALVAHNDSTSMTAHGKSFPLDAILITDGSQFATAVLSSRNGSVDPPETLRFYWPYTRRIVELAFSKNVTRFGIPLMRYTVDNWQMSTNLPSGLNNAATTADDVTAPPHSINMSLLLNNLPVVLSTAPLTPTDNTLEPRREVAVDVDPITGMVYHQRMSWQLTALINLPDGPNDLWHSKMAATWLPVLWVREQSSISPSKALEFEASTTKSGPFATEKLAWWGVVGGSACIILGVVTTIVCVRRSRVMQVRKLRSVKPAGFTGSSTTGGKIDLSLSGKAFESTSTNDSQLLERQIDAASGVTVAASDLSTVHTSPRARKRMAPRIATITKDREDTPDIHEV